MNYDDLLTCYRSDQIPEPEFQEILRDDEVFKKWFHKQIEEGRKNSVQPS
jgi:hypothetical protein